MYAKPFETWRIPIPPVNCCSSSASICAPVSVIVTRLLPNGWTVNASP